MPTNEERKKKIKGDLMNAVKVDVRDAKIDKSVRTEMVDGKIKGNYNVNGLPTTSKNDCGGSWRDYDKIFDTWKEYNAYTEAFFQTDFKDFK